MRFCSFFFFGFLLTLASCIGQRKALYNNYLENVSDTAWKNALMFPETVIQKGDLLSIQIYSASIKPEIDAPYNLPQGASNVASSGTGFLVNEQGNIEYPRIGTLPVAGITKAKLSDVIKKKLENELTDPSVIIRFINYRITVLGEVRTPGSFSLPTENITVLEALGLAGDITEFGNKTAIKVLRENNGQREIGTINLTSKEMFNSPFYHLQQNDKIFIEQNSERIRQREQQRVATQIGIASTVITTIALIISLTK